MYRPAVFRAYGWMTVPELRLQKLTARIYKAATRLCIAVTANRAVYRTAWGISERYKDSVRDRVYGIRLHQWHLREKPSSANRTQEGF
jgi:hypothetical protein